MQMLSLYLLIPGAPLAGAIIAGLLGRKIGCRLTHWITIFGITLSLLTSIFVLNEQLQGKISITHSHAVYTWLTVAGIEFNMGLLIDNLTALMLVIITSISLLVHIYTIGYMKGDLGYQRFFSYISLFTFAMLILVMADNFIQLFCAWELVGLISYLLIGFWFKRPAAISANLKAFLINRIGDVGFLIGIALILAHAGTLDYQAVFLKLAELKTTHITLFSNISYPLITVICILLFTGAMGKSAQFPLHVWLPDSMEGPTPISALIHAATMVTAGIFMVARLSPIFEHSAAALSFILIIGAITALFMGILGLVQNDIKRVIAYSTLSQLGYMTMALGVSAYSAAIFHLMTHAFFKALLFLAAGSVIIGLHHQQDMRKMGGIRKYMPITWITFLIGVLALTAVPFFSGFYSKDTIIEAIQHSNIPGAKLAYFSALAGVFITAFYAFRMYFMIFHGSGNYADSKLSSASHMPTESPLIIIGPLILLAIPSLLIGYWTFQPIISGPFFSHILITPNSPSGLSAAAMAIHAFSTLPFWLTVMGLISAAGLFYLRSSHLNQDAKRNKNPLFIFLEHKYFIDDLYIILAKAAQRTGNFLWKWGDATFIDGILVNGSAKLIAKISYLLKRVQTGYIYHYTFVMIIGIFLLITWWLGGALLNTISTLI